MSAFDRFVARIRALFHAAELDRDLADELEFHRAMLTEDNIRRGLPPDEARRHAAITLGGQSALRMRHRDERGLPTLDALLQDVRIAYRGVVANRWFTAAVALVLGLGMAANTLGFAIVSAAFLRGMPVPEPDRVLFISWIDRDGHRDPVSCPEWLDWKSSTRAFEDLAGYDERSASLGDDYAVPLQVQATALTVNSFRVLRLQPVRGRDFTADDARPGAEAVVIVSDALWSTRYARRDDVIGATVRIDGKPATLIGVMPAAMKFPDQSDLWLPFVPDPTHSERDDRQLQVFGRLRPGATQRQAQAEFDTIARSLIATYPDTAADETGARVETIADAMIGGVGRRLFVTIMTVVVFVMLIAVANAANLVVLRAGARERELALRVAMGATRARLIRLLLIESLLLSTVGAVLALAMLPPALSAFAAAMRNGGMPFWVRFSIDGSTLAYAGALTLATAIVFGLPAALQATRSITNDVLKDGARGTSGGRRQRRFATAMVIAEVTVAIALLGGAGLLARSFVALYSVDLGVDIDRLVTMQIALPQERYSTPERRVAFMNEWQSRIAAVPGVDAATITTGVPSRDGGERLLQTDRSANAEPVFVSTVAITPTFFDTIGVQPIRGRALRDVDGIEGSEVGIINERLAAQFFPGQDPIGRKLRFTRRQSQLGLVPEPWRIVIGVVPDVDHGSPQDGYVNATVYVPYREQADPSAWLLVRTTLGLDAVAAPIRRETQRLDPDLPVGSSRTIRDLLAQDRWTYRMFGALFSGFALIATCLSAAALYTVVAHGVARRTPEFGLRVALGATRSDVAWMVVRQVLQPVAVGVVLGVAGALLVGKTLGGMLVGVTSDDAPTLIAVTLTFMAICVIACVQPTVRAMRLNPLDALRTE